MVLGVNGLNGHLVQNLAGMEPGDGIENVTLLHQLMVANPVLELMGNRSIAACPHVLFMANGKLFTHMTTQNVLNFV
jgi:hypothetical protein